MNDPAERLVERVLILRCQTGDAGAYRELVDLYGPRLRYFLRSLLAGGGQVDDVLQEVWIDVFRQLPRLQDAGAFTAWLYRIARGQAALDGRRRGRRPHESELGELAVVDDEGPDFSPVDAVEIHAALDRLPVAQREVLVLKFIENLSYEDIALVLSCPLGTVRSRLYYAKQALARLLKS